MNFFYCDESLESCAMALDDRRLTKMVLETAQLLNNVLVHFGDMSAPYKATHMNHPSSVWTRTSPSNYKRMLAYFEFICLEFEHRRGKKHKCEDHYHTFVQFAFDLLEDDWDKPYGTPVPNCTTHKDMTNVIEAYRLHLRDKWDAEYANHEAGYWYEPTWTKREPPTWYERPPKFLIHPATTLTVTWSQTDQKIIKELAQKSKLTAN